MKCTIENANLKTWNRVIHALSVTGDQDIYFSFTDSTLTLTAFGSSLEVCVTCTFFRNFFLSYNVPRDTDHLFRVPSKCILKPFRSMRFLTKCVTFCQIEFEAGKDTIIVTMGCKSGAEIRYTIDLASDAELLQIEQDPDNLKNFIKTEPKLIIGSLSNFAHSKGLNDLTLQVKGNKLYLKNCMTDLVKKEGRIYTEFVLNAVDFVEYSIQEDSELTFGLREFKNFAGLAEHMKLPFSVHFQGALDPVVFTLKTEMLESTMTLATKVLPDEDSQAPPTPQSSITSNGRISNVSSVDPRNSPKEKEVVRKEVPSCSSDVIIVSATGPVEPIRDSATATPYPETNSESLLAGELNQVEEYAPPVVEFQVPAPTTVRKGERRNKKRRDAENIPPGPPSKRIRDMFPNIGVPFDIYHAFPGHDVVLAGASDEEEEPNTNY